MDQINIASLEELCNTFYTSADQDQRSAAGKTLSSILEDTSNFKSVYEILSLSNHPQLLFLAVSTFTNILPSVWKSLSIPDELLLFENIFSMLFGDVSEKSSYVIGGLTKSLARICRLGWIDLEPVKSVIVNIESLLILNPSKLEAALKFFQELISEINEPLKYRSLTLNRKIAQFFKEDMLGKIFSYCLALLPNVKSLNENALLNLLNVLILCLSFEFYSTVSDDIGEDNPGLYMPSSWKVYFENPDFFEYLRFIIVNSSGEIEVAAFRLLNYFGTVKKSVFSSNTELRSNYIGKYLKISEQLCLSKVISGDSLFQFMTGLKNFFNNFGLKEVSENQLFHSWIQIFKGFCTNLFTRDDAIFSSYESSIIIWSYLSYESHVYNLPIISAQIVSLFKSFLGLTLANARSEIIIENIEGIREQVDMIADFSLYYYSDLMKEMHERYFEVLELYESTQNQEFQAKLAWLIIIASAFVSLRDVKNYMNEGNMDANMAHLIFQLITKIPEKELSLHIAIIVFLTNFSKAYVNCPDCQIWTIFNPLNENLEETSIQIISLIIEIIFKHLSDCNNKFLIKYSLELFEFLAKGYYSNILLVKVPLIQNFMINYSNYSLCLADSKIRAQLFSNLAHLWISETVGRELDNFLYPIGEMISMNISIKNPRFFEFLFRELQGICSAISGQKKFLEFFDWFIEKIEVLMIVCQNFLLEEVVMQSLLKFLVEVTDGKNARIKFPDSSGNGVLLFKKLSEVLVPYGNYLADHAMEVTNFQGKVKRIIGILKNLTSGGYVCFGVFEIYNDTCFIETLKMSFRLIDLLILTQITTYTKLIDNLYDYIEILSRNFSKLIFQHIPLPSISTLISYLKSGIKSSTIKHCISSANSTTYITESIIILSKNPSTSRLQLQEFLSQISQTISELLEIIIEIIILEDSNFMWSLSKPLLGLIIINENNYENVVRYALNKVSNNPAYQDELGKSLTHLMDNVPRTLDCKSKETFGKNFSELRSVISQFT
ncbi:hypothetical protein SteCoe_9623 [Stentor coeruleus]|uniref:Exportin-7/Ran-binding protein 17 TPR repeats domain-containing protein n=1 Tax=Stentor coeruleus TaxID=5963 RepID=A0A1R2CH80_9CILI|nr:hypothetical protein SteCoe_9623 [Stentor coeruleus]